MTRAAVKRIPCRTCGWTIVNDGTRRGKPPYCDAMCRFFQKVSVSETGCWVWTGSKWPGGYGSLRIDGVTVAAHRFSYEQQVGAIEPGFELDHLCRTPECIRPDHLEPVTSDENNARRWAGYDACSKGHLFDEENTYIRPTGHRDCRACIRRRVREYRARRAGVAA